MPSFGKPADTIVHQQEPLNAEPPRSALAGAPITPLERFYVRNHGPVPAGTESLRVTGLVAQALELSLADLQALPRRELTATLQCAGNRREGLIEVRDIPGEAPWGPGATGTARWAGAALADVLAAAGVDPAARHVGLGGADHADEAVPPQRYDISIPLAKALRPEVLLAWEMNGEPLTPVHGAPLRAVVPGYIGARSVKWLERIELRREPSEGYYQATAYRLLPEDGVPAPGVGIPLGEVALNSDILSPCDGDRLPAGSVELSGYAFAGGDRSVARVEVCADGGHWTAAELLEDQGKWAWRLWRATLDLPAGRHTLLARAWDSAGATQPEHAATVWNPKGYANSAWGRVTVEAD
ncbi:MAG TPA: sulfite oxidase [Solirubrobacteraceae bacterium]|nr:sulfite oxidase [Solirubrobacteraceae bacterium]